MNGNIESLDRRGPDGSSGYIDELSYTYNGNQLTKVEDASGIYNNYDFRDMVHTAEEYHYDANGNMRQDDNKGIANVSVR